MWDKCEYTTGCAAKIYIFTLVTVKTMKNSLAGTGHCLLSTFWELQSVPQCVLVFFCCCFVSLWLSDSFLNRKYKYFPMKTIHDKYEHFSAALSFFFPFAPLHGVWLHEPVERSVIWRVSDACIWRQNSVLLWCSAAAILPWICTCQHNGRVDRVCAGSCSKVMDRG